MRIPFQALNILLSLGSARLSFAQDEFYNRHSSGYTYRIGTKIEQDWQLGSLGRDFTFGFNPSGVISKTMSRVCSICRTLESAGR